jgi:hypothetical protein
MGLFTRRYEHRVPKRLRDLGESYHVPRPNRYLPSAEGGAPYDEEPDTDVDELFREDEQQYAVVGNGAAVGNGNGRH